jgi:hypothetical protein
MAERLRERLLEWPGALLEDKCHSLAIHWRMAPEAAAAILFVRTVSDVMLGNVDGASAPDPRDYEITTTMEKSEESAKAPAPEPKQSATPTPEEGPKPESEEPESEDTAPPIKVGGNQVTEAYRERIRRLMSGR